MGNVKVIYSNESKNIIYVYKTLIDIIIADQESNLKSNQNQEGESIEENYSVLQDFYDE